MIAKLARKAPLLALALALGLLGAWSAGPRPVSSQAIDPVARAEAYLRGAAPALGLQPDLSDLRLLEVRSGRSSQHVRYQQTINGLPVFGRYLNVAVPRDSASVAPPLVSGLARGGSGPGPRSPAFSGQDALSFVGERVSLAPSNRRGPVSADLVYFPHEDAGYELAWQVTAPIRQPLASWLFLVSAETGRVLIQQDLLVSDTGSVFDPNPPQNSGGAIPPPVDCDSAGEEATLSSQYVTRTLRGISQGQDKLIGQYVDLSAPGIVGGYKPAAVASEPSGNYVYGCNDDRFEEVMAYHHLDTVQRKVQALGFADVSGSGIVDRPVSVHAHYYSGCNAFFDPGNLGLHFGDGDSGSCPRSTDAAEDGDVIIHEYGHAIQHDQVPGWGFGPSSVSGQAQAMGEGFADFLPSAISGDPCMGEWFSFGNTACGGAPGLRSLENNAFFNGVSVINLPSWCSSASDPHCAGLVWGGALWDLVQALGGAETARDVVLTLVLDGHFYMTPQATYHEAAAAIRQSDTLLYGGAHVGAIDSVFSARGISATGPVSDYSYAYLRILHPRRGDLDVNLLAGPDPQNPLCAEIVWEPNPADNTDDLVGFLDLDGSPCQPFLPPSGSVPWWLEVRDVRANQIGTLEQFEMVLSGAGRCLATDLPIAIPDNNGFVYSSVDCSTVVEAPGDTDGDTLPDPVDDDDDNDGYLDADEVLIGTDHKDACADTATANDEADDKWPPDFDDNRAVNISDIGALLPPYFGASAAQPAYSPRRDIAPDDVLNISDVGKLLPPTFGSVCS